MDEEQLMCRETDLTPDNISYSPLPTRRRDRGTESRSRDSTPDSVPDLIGSQCASPESPRPELSAVNRPIAKNAREDFEAWRKRMREPWPVKQPSTESAVDQRVKTVQAINELTAVAEEAPLAYPDTIFTPEAFEMFRITFEAACYSSEADATKQRNVLLRQLRHQARAVLMRIPEDWSVKQILDHFQQLVQTEDDHTVKATPPADESDSEEEDVIEVSDDMDHGSEHTQPPEPKNDDEGSVTDGEDGRPNTSYHRRQAEYLEHFNAVASNHNLDRHQLREAIGDYHQKRGSERRRNWMNRTEQYDMLLSLCNQDCREYVRKHDHECNVGHAIQLIATYVGRHGAGSHWITSPNSQHHPAGRFRCDLFDRLLNEFQLAINEQEMFQRKRERELKPDTNSQSDRSGEDSGHHEGYSGSEHDDRHEPSPSKTVTSSRVRGEDTRDSIPVRSRVCRRISLDDLFNREARRPTPNDVTRELFRRCEHSPGPNDSEARLARRLTNHRIMALSTRIRNCEQRERYQNSTIKQLQHRLDIANNRQPECGPVNHHVNSNRRWQPAQGSAHNYRATRGRPNNWK